MNLYLWFLVRINKWFFIKVNYFIIDKSFAFKVEAA